MSTRLRVHIGSRHLLQTGAGYSSDSSSKFDDTLYTLNDVELPNQRADCLACSLRDAVLTFLPHCQSQRHSGRRVRISKDPHSRSVMTLSIQRPRRSIEMRMSASFKVLVKAKQVNCEP